MNFEDPSLDSYEKTKQRQRNNLDRDVQGKNKKSPEERVESFVDGLSEGATINTHEGKWTVTYVKKDKQGQTIIGREKISVDAKGEKGISVKGNITAEGLKREILESRKRMGGKSGNKNNPEKNQTTQSKKSEEKEIAENVAESPSSEEDFGYDPDKNRDLRAGSANRDTGVIGENLDSESVEKDFPQDKKTESSEEPLGEKKEKSEFRDREINAEKQFSPHDRVTVKRSSGEMEEDWTYIGQEPNSGRIIVMKTDQDTGQMISKDVDLNELIEWQKKESTITELEKPKKEEILEESSDSKEAPDLLSRTREQIENNKLELSEETVGEWKDYLKERHHVLLSDIARGFCEKNGLIQKGRENDSAFYIQQLNERGGLKALGEEDRARLEEMERLIDMTEMHGQQMTIDARYLLLYFGEARVEDLKGVIKEKKWEGSSLVQEKVELEKIRDMQADILSETLKGENGEENFKQKIYEKADEELRQEYENQGRLEEFEKNKKRQGKGKSVKFGQERKGSEDEFIARQEKIYHRILGEEIAEIVGDREKAKGGIENWYGEIKTGLVKELVDKIDRGELKGKLGLDTDKEPKDEKEEDAMISEGLSEMTGREVPEEEARQGKEKLKKFLGKSWEGTKKVGGILGMVALLYMISFALLGFAIAAKVLGVKTKEGKK